MIASILFGLATVIRLVLNMAMMSIFLSVLFNLINADRHNPFVQMISSLTEPMCRPFRKLTARYHGPLDLSRVIVLLIIIFLLEVIPRYLLDLAQRM
jgi:uncharacterized protein YggT (Ycf19 family)